MRFSMNDYPTLLEWRSLTAAQDNAYLIVSVLSGVVLVALMLLIRWRVKVQLWHIVAIGAVIRVPMLFTSFWYDETFSALIATMPLDSFRVAILSDVHPPLPYLIQWLIAHAFGNSELAMRLPAYIAGVGLIWLVGRWAYTDDEMRLYMAATVALLPSAVFYSAEARQYMLLSYTVVWALYLIRHNSRHQWIAIMLLPLLHAHGYLYAAVLGAWAWSISGLTQWVDYDKVQGAVFSSNPSLRRNRTRYAAIASIPGLIWLPVMMMQSRDVADGFWLGDVTLGASVRWLTDMTMGIQLTPETALLAMVTAAVLTTGVIVTRQASRLMLSVALGVPVVTWLVSLTWHNIMLSRAMLPSAIVMAMLWGWLMWRYPVARVGMAVLAIVTSMAIVRPDVQRLDYRAYVSECQGADIYTISPQMGIIARYYTDATVYLWTQGDDLNQHLSAPARAAFGLRPASAPPSGTCLLYKDNPLMTESQRAHVISVTHGQSPTTLLTTSTMGIYLWWI